MVTGSHNPPDHNGFKLVLGKQAVLRRGDPAARADALAAGARRRGARPGRRAQRCSTTYVARLAHDYDGDAAAHGRLGLPATAPPARSLHAARRAAAGPAYPAQRDDRRAPSRRITPTRPSRRTWCSCRQAVTTERCDLGIAFDGDGDRIGVVDGKGRILWGDQLHDRAGARRAAPPSRRHHHRRRQGEPGAVRRDRARSAASR